MAQFELHRLARGAGVRNLSVCNTHESMIAMVQIDQKKDSLRGKWKRWRWAWLALAVVGVVMTPAAVFNAIDLYRSDHRLGFAIPLGLSIRFAQIFGFSWLWWKTRPVDSN
jgi:hypothetical protein